MIDQYVSEVRAFNRFYTVFMGILNKRFLNSKYSLPETRVLHAVYTKSGVTPTEIISMLNIDKSYLSRMIVGLEKNTLIVKEKSGDDGRSIKLNITALGKKEFEKLDAASGKEISKILDHLSEDECRQLTKSMDTIKKILSKPPL